MSARVLIVDDLPTNLKVLEAKLTAEYFTVITADSGAGAIEAAKAESPDIVLLDVMMPEMDGFETCRRLKADPETAHIPVVMVTALSDVADRVTGLEAGADDFLTKPVNDLTLFARVRSLARMKRAMDEWRLREETCDQFGVMGNEVDTAMDERMAGTVLVIEPDRFLGERLIGVLEQEGHNVSAVASAEEAHAWLGANVADLIITSLYLPDGDGLRLCSELRAVDALRAMPILLVIEEEEVGGLVKGFELGVNDYLIRPIDANELRARVRTQLRQKRYRQRLQETYQRSLSMALTDDLTGLYNHRYLVVHMNSAIERAKLTGKPLSLLMIDIDYFKKVNDGFGHDVGDKVLKELASRMLHNVREFDMAARRGGEEFVVVMPDCDSEAAGKVAERLRAVVAATPIRVGDKSVPITISIGVASLAAADDTAEAVLSRADKALYAAKNAGRDRVAVEHTDGAADGPRFAASS